jgi:hypothetical protein
VLSSGFSCCSARCKDGQYGGTSIPYALPTRMTSSSRAFDTALT